MVDKIVVNTQMISGLLSLYPNLIYLRNSLSDLTVCASKYATQNISNIMQGISDLMIYPNIYMCVFLSSRTMVV